MLPGNCKSFYLNLNYAVFVIILTKNLSPIVDTRYCNFCFIIMIIIVLIIRRIFRQDIHFNELKLLLLMCVLCPMP